MSTITKLDKNVRLDRYLRKEQRRELQKNHGVADLLCRQGQRVIDSPDYTHYTAGSRFKHEQLLKEMIVRRTVMALILKHITKICMSPFRTGARKEAILAKLGTPK